MRHSQFTRLVFSLLCSILLVLLAACSSTPSTGSQTPVDGSSVSSSQPASTPTPATQPVPATRTDCPARGAARAWVTAPLALGSDPVIVYMVNQVDKSGNYVLGTLKSYDVATGKKTVITSILHVNIDEYNAQISRDGQWIFFATYSQLPLGQYGRSELKAVRLDGQGLQTLYCGSDFSSQFRLSPDQQFLALRDTGSIQIIRLATGQMQTLLQPADNSGRSALLLNAWVDATHISISTSTEDGPQEEGIDLLDISKGTNQSTQDLTSVLSGLHGAFSNDANDFYVDYNGCDQSTCAPPSKIIALPLTGGSSQTIWQSTQYNLSEVCPINGQQFLVSVVNFAQPSGSAPPDASHNGIWLMNRAGTLVRRFVAIGIGGSVMPMGGDCTSTWQHVSRNSSMYVFARSVTTSSSNYTPELIYGNLDGSGSPTVFAQGGANLIIAPVGWTTI